MKKEWDVLKIIRASGILLLLFVVNTIIVTNILFLVKISITSFHLFISLAITLLEYYFLYRKKINIKQAITSILLVILLLVLTVMISSKTYDLTWDGNTYHKTAIGSLKNGWNPVYEKVEDFTQEKGNAIDIDKNEQNRTWVNHYPKASWIFAANIYHLTNNIESGKVLGCLMIYIAFSLFFTYLVRRMTKIKAFFISLLIVFNPITIPQIFTYYIDGLLCISLFIIVYCLIAITMDRIKHDAEDNLAIEEDNHFNIKEHFLILAYAIIFIINLKFTGLVYAAVFCGLFYLYWLYQSYKAGSLKQKFIHYTAFYAIVVIFAVVIVGYSPYVKNLLEKGHPFYPLFGEGKLDIITFNQPQYFKHRNVFQKFAITMFSEGSNVHDSYGDNNDKPHLKAPFTIGKNEIQEYARPDTRISGFGPLYSGIFIISCMLTVYMLYRFWKDKRQDIFIPFLLILFGMLILVLATDGSWWARYTPYLYLIPMFNVMYLLSNKEGKMTRFNLILVVILLALVAVNNGIIAYANMKDHIPKYGQISAKYQKFEDYSQDKDKITVQLKTGGFEGLKYNIYDVIGDKNIQYVDEINGKSTYVHFFSYKIY